ncbi:CPBP family intramembrane glutamic endopeptidase [Methylotenera sp.]|uniref:CPBP family intramembrane glutamic endopeptidase n=1 Tax=Methylotenera sp. TaxID=2051956 RepID=UPI002733F94C|nr:CPBP family intramembrane glutamic endopeptidase [Methylotenera sp.]MDP3212187.1 CPBP family intramembrane metalloprotease [Methylotenera sp.]
MSEFQQVALALAGVWLSVVAIGMRRSTPALLIGLVGLAWLAGLAVLRGDLTLAALGLGAPSSWFTTLLMALVWTGLMFAFSPLADRIASRWFTKPPTLGAFRTLQQSKLKLAGGIVVAWFLGGFLEELVFRGIILQALEAWFAPALSPHLGSFFAIVFTAGGSAIIHLYQGPRAAFIVAQLSVLFGLFFVLTGHNLWAVMLAHGFYDTVAFIRFARGKSKYADLDAETSQKV